MLMPPVRADDPIRDFYGRLMKEEGGKTSLPTKVAAAVSQRVWTGGGTVYWPHPTTLPSVSPISAADVSSDNSYCGCSAFTLHFARR